jgi:hypothetical protein
MGHAQAILAVLVLTSALAACGPDVRADRESVESDVARLTEALVTYAPVAQPSIDKREVVSRRIRFDMPSGISNVPPIIDTVARQLGYTRMTLSSPEMYRFLAVYCRTGIGVRSITLSEVTVRPTKLELAVNSESPAVGLGMQCGSRALAVGQDGRESNNR